MHSAVALKHATFIIIAGVIWPSLLCPYSKVIFFTISSFLFLFARLVNPCSTALLPTMVQAGVGLHYPCMQHGKNANRPHPNITEVFHKKLWSTEDSSTPAGWQGTASLQGLLTFGGVRRQLFVFNVGGRWAHHWSRSHPRPSLVRCRPLVCLAPHRPPAHWDTPIPIRAKRHTRPDERGLSAVC